MRRRSRRLGTAPARTARIRRPVSANGCIGCADTGPDRNARRALRQRLPVEDDRFRLGADNLVPSAVPDPRAASAACGVKFAIRTRIAPETPPASTGAKLMCDICGIALSARAFADIVDDEAGCLRELLVRHPSSRPPPPRPSGRGWHISSRQNGAERPLFWPGACRLVARKSADAEDRTSHRHRR